MVSLSTAIDRVDGVTLVTARLDTDDRPQRVRLEHRLDGPLWPPRRRGVPAASWDDDGFETTAGAGETVAVGYASPAPPADPPLVVADVTRVDETEPGAHGRAIGDPVPDVDATPDGVVRALGTPVPPRDAVPDPTVEDAADDEAIVESESAATDGERDTARNDGIDEPGTNSGDGETESVYGSSDDRAGDEAIADATRSSGEIRTPSGGIDDPLATVAARIEVAEALSASTRLSAATPVIATAGGAEGVRRLDERLSEDATRLRAIAERASRLAERAEEATVPVAAVEGLA